MEIMHTILSAMWFFVPAYFANMAPVFAAKIKWLDFLKKPVDNGYKLRNRSLLGKNKTWRGVFSGVAIGIAFAYLQRYLIRFSFFSSISILDYSNMNLFFWGLLLSSGALIGDMIESLAKRQLDIKPGRPFFPFDQLDFTVFGLLFGFVMYIPGKEIIITLMIVNLAVHFLANVIGYFLGIKEVWY
ncbi:hypothetical protein COV93_00425 [Candidatus Woesearchaeota archaeon CG11_big_fil_rev_8_21_14_0_20_43_8]|nr:MAG: hypothetical protein COV93_00425 [Candidatus Woesearchaeota archaeon CG11_big_fil_rev_8_21_14_0_20_43_8]PIO06920.1 MAG: hypothetical protein COT47_02265 [Candidatus Woesearchaeota archaeon CG08_land_8_20_14_0_20_43_7]